MTNKVKSTWSPSALAELKRYNEEEQFLLSQADESADALVLNTGHISIDDVEDTLFTVEDTVSELRALLSRLRLVEDDREYLRQKVARHSKPAKKKKTTAKKKGGKS